MTPRKRTLRGHLFSNSQEEDVIEEMTRRWMTNWNDYGVRDIVHTMKQWDSLVQLHAATLMCNIIIQEYEDDGSSAPAELLDLRKRASNGLPFGSGLHDYVVTLLISLPVNVIPPSYTDPAFVNKVLDDHNTVRAKVIPEASHMLYMVRVRVLRSSYFIVE
ncbi:hypothetical protein NDU88_005067 [Pleurodeles waltl]|uniref:Uncharacterized protein n=1 Tax=Pleurodeles waltl TaxID=8319 RepID=A0AAV7SKM0_PLEWA|nr:hypothetical protein NDU88_005067 [Pleurodeles waltl]